MRHTISSPMSLRRRVDRLEERRGVLVQMKREREERLKGLLDYLGVAEQVSQALDQLSGDLFAKFTTALETELTYALREVLEQPIALKVNREFLHGAVSLEFEIEREGHREDILRGQGGSVANVLSVGLRLFALTTLDEAEHRRFVVLDEQDCWLRPDLVPRLAKIVHEAARSLGFQVLLISHHDVSAFEAFADKIYKFTPAPDGVSVKAMGQLPATPDA